MNNERSIYETETGSTQPDPDSVPIRDRRIFTQTYDLVVGSLIDQITEGTIFLRPISERPSFQRRYVWGNPLASRLIESILLNVPIPPCYLSQNANFELDVIDGQQRIFSIYRFLENQFPLSGLEVLKDLIGKRFHELPQKIQRQIKTHTLRLVAITNESHPEIKFDIFQRLNTNTVPLNAQELRNCIYRGALNDLLKEAVNYKPWLELLDKKNADKRMRDEELILRFFSFNVRGITSYKTPQKIWLNEMAEKGMNYSKGKIKTLYVEWQQAVDISLIWFTPQECFRRKIEGNLQRNINRALFDLTTFSATRTQRDRALARKAIFRKQYYRLLKNEEFADLISRSLDHTKRTKRRFEMWMQHVDRVLR